MCGRYALGVRMAFVRQRLQQQGMQVDEVPEDDEIRETYNFAPGYYGAVYRGDAQNEASDASDGGHEDAAASDTLNYQENTKFKLQKMRWGLIPFWTKRQPDYGSMMRTINCRDDSLIENKGMWTSMKKKKRCVIVCQGFYEWLKKGPSGKEKIPHYTKRKDGDLMYFAGLWDCVQYEDSDEKLYTYSIITTDSNPYLKFLHDRMPVILDPGSEKMKKWLDPHQTTWTKELQSILKPYEGDLECYPVSKEVGKVGNNSPDYIVPVNSKQNKNNIANFFANASATEKKKKIDPKTGLHNEDSALGSGARDVQIKNDLRETVDDEWTEDNAPKPVLQKGNDEIPPKGVKRERSPDDNTDFTTNTSSSKKAVKRSELTTPRKREKSTSPIQTQLMSGKKMKSAAENNTNMSPMKNKSHKMSRHVIPSDGSQKITDFFKK
ncbi:hypothetical protein UA08_00443 [Talaromyces atroroseus]|uniref:DUF159 domain protein n=1 Tax=Talaromyces atroroseus TaxID=1441469 RepID=A0A225BEJ2_TALAT|nr:hypothetical protein UA08_00443 [Talaromyces atroroseus]OKL64457.1 hypothetical protein UA08_00443 [Talaromyces atroroseus]